MLLLTFNLHRFVKEKLGPSVYSEEQFIFLCHLVAPFLSRYNLDKPSPSILDITVELFNALERMDKHVQTLRYMDPICDLLYPFIFIFYKKNLIQIVSGEAWMYTIGRQFTKSPLPHTHFIIK